MTWTKKYDEFCLRQILRPSTRLLLRWLLRRAKLTEICELEIDLNKFNDWVAKQRGKKYDRKTIREAIAQLDEKTMGMVVILKSYSPWVHKIIIRPLSFIAWEKSQSWGQSPIPPTAKPMFDGEQKKTSSDLLLQNISRLDSLLRNLGMNCNAETLHRMWRYAGRKMSEVENAVEYMLKCHKEKMELSHSLNGEQKGIVKPVAWLHDCLKYGRHINCDDEIVDLPVFDTISALASFVKGISPPKPSTDRNQPPILT